MKKDRLLSPGPTPVPSEVLLELARPVIHHRTPANAAILREATDALKALIQTRNDPIILTSSGTGAMEAALVNVAAAGEKVIVVRGGKFGERWTEIAQAYGVVAINLDVTWGHAVDPQVVAKALKDHPDAVAVCTTHCETSTAVAHDVKALAAVTRSTPALLLVDAISALGAMELRMDEWGVDAVVSGSQKALMLPPGLAIVALSDKAWAKVENTKRMTYYFDLLKAKKSVAKNDTPWTPAHTLILALRRSLQLIAEAGGVEAMWKRNADLAAATRKAVLSMGLALYSQAPADAVTAIVLPQGVKGEQVVDRMRDHYGVTVAGGQESLKGRICRIAHMGFIDRFDVIAGLIALANALRDAGKPVSTSGIADAFADVE
jgi:aspartate aminotransferase-like enzyme